MKAHLCYTLLPAIVLCIAGTIGALADGRIVVIGDDWTMCDSWWTGDTENLARNSFGWLGEGGAGGAALVAGYFDVWLPPHENLRRCLAEAGYVETTLSTRDWTPAILADHDLVVASFSEGFEQPGMDVQAMVDYVNTGGDVLLVTGEWHHLDDIITPFLDAFGIAAHDLVDLTDWTSEFLPHPVTEGVTQLQFGGPAWMDTTGANPDALIVSTFLYEGQQLGWIAVVPEPATLSLLMVAGALLASRPRGRWFT